MAAVTINVHLDNLVPLSCREFPLCESPFVSLDFGDGVSMFVRDAEKLAELAAIVAQAQQTIARWDTTAAAATGSDDAGREQAGRGLVDSSVRGGGA